MTQHNFTQTSVVKLAWKDLFTVENNILGIFYTKLHIEKIANCMHKHKVTHFNKFDLVSFVVLKPTSARTKSVNSIVYKEV